MVHPESDANDFADLQKASLATYRRTPLMDRVYLTTLVEGAGQKIDNYFAQIKQFDTAKEAIRAVRQKQFDCVMINTMV